CVSIMNPNNLHLVLAMNGQQTVLYVVYCDHIDDLSSTITVQKAIQYHISTQFQLNLVIQVTTSMLHQKYLRNDNLHKYPHGPSSLYRVLLIRVNNDLALAASIANRALVKYLE